MYSYLMLNKNPISVAGFGDRIHLTASLSFVPMGLGAACCRSTKIALAGAQRWTQAGDPCTGRRTPFLSVQAPCCTHRSGTNVRFASHMTISPPTPQSLFFTACVFSWLRLEQEKLLSSPFIFHCYFCLFTDLYIIQSWFLVFHVSLSLLSPKGHSYTWHRSWTALLATTLAHEI